MAALRYRIVNVFAESALAGNPLCVFEDGSSLDTATMQALALQFNLSETTFIVPPTVAGATAQVRIFTPGFEMPFAGHPTLGTAHVVRELKNAGDSVKLEMKAGVIPVEARGDGVDRQLLSRFVDFNRGDHEANERGVDACGAEEEGDSGGGQHARTHRHRSHPRHRVGHSWWAGQPGN